MCTSLPTKACQLCPRGRTWALAWCARCNRGVCCDHVAFDAATKEWLCVRCSEQAKPIQLKPKPATKPVNRVKRPPIWEEALAA